MQAIAANRPLCYVLIPRGRVTGGGIDVDFDAVYRDIVAPALVDAGFEPARARTMAAATDFREQLMLCEYAIVDLSAAGAEVFHALGLRDALRPARTLTLLAQGAAPVACDSLTRRALPYAVEPDGRPVAAASVRDAIASRLGDARAAASDSALFRIVEEFPDIQRLKTDVFRERVAVESPLAERLSAARTDGVESVRAVGETLARATGGIAGASAAAVIDLFLSYRAVEGWSEMIALVPQMAAPLARSVLVQEQLGFALNRAGRGDDAERVLLAVLDRRGPSSETYSLLGRVYKDRWESALAAGDVVNARGVLAQAIDAYLRGFEADWRDAFPGINAVTLMELCEPPDPRRSQLVPVVAYAAARRIAGGRPDYWDYATQLELAVLARNEGGAQAALRKALGAVRERWEPASTARNLRLIREARRRRGETIAWAAELEQTLAQRAAK